MARALALVMPSSLSVTSRLRLDALLPSHRYMTSQTDVPPGLMTSVMVFANADGHGQRMTQPGLNQRMQPAGAGILATSEPILI